MKAGPQLWFICMVGVLGIWAVWIHAVKPTFRAFGASIAVNAVIGAALMIVIIKGEV